MTPLLGMMYELFFIKKIDLKPFSKLLYGSENLEFIGQES